MIPFVGPSYQLATRKASVQRSVNLFLFGMETPSKAQFILQSVPGLALFASLIEEVRCIYEAAGRCFVVSGDTLYELDSVGNATARGTLGTSTGPVEMAWGTLQLVIVDGPNGYVLTLATNAFTTIVSAGWLGSDRVCFLDGYFIFVDPGTQTFYLSAIDDATSLDVLDFASAESSPDPVIAHLINHRELWLFGDQSTEVWFDAGLIDFPFSRNNGAVLEIGCIAQFSAQKIDNGVIWIGRDRNGAGIVYRAVGYQPQRVSTVAVEEALQASTDLSSAVAYVYQSNGQTFYAVNAPGLESTWCFEVASGAWHERCDVDQDGLFIAHRALNHSFVFGKHLVGSADGSVYRMDATLNTFDGDPLKRTRISPNSVTPMRDRIYYYEFVLDCTTGGAGQGVTPMVELSWSDDGGMTYNTPVLEESTGAVGNYYARVIWYRLGQSRDRVWRIDFSDDAPFSIIDGVAR
jgi:hypothetical protein